MVFIVYIYGICTHAPNCGSQLRRKLLALDTADGALEVYRQSSKKFDSEYLVLFMENKFVKTYVWQAKNLYYEIL